MADDDVPLYEFGPFDVAIRYKCPAINQYNTFREEPGNIHCEKLVVYPKFTRFTKNVNRCSKISPVSSDQVIVKRTCNTIKASTEVIFPGNVIRINSYSCKFPATASSSYVLKRGNRCAINFTKVVTLVKGNTCRLSSKTLLATDLIAKRVCRNRYNTDETIIKTTKFRRLCGTFPIMSVDSRWACKVVVLTKIQPLSLRTRINLGICRIPGILDTSLYATSRVCIRLHMSEFDIIAQSGVKVPRVGAWTCKIYPLYEQNLSGNKTCGTIRTIPIGSFRYKGSEARLSCKIIPTMNINGRRWRCGTVVLTQVDTRTFGRIWGGKPENNFFIRQDGRMIGKFR
ncbi:hypothetical protein D3C87_1033040 [compost metagenome]